MSATHSLSDFGAALGDAVRIEHGRHRRRQRVAMVASLALVMIGVGSVAALGLNRSQEPNIADGSPSQPVVATDDDDETSVPNPSPDGSTVDEDEGGRSDDSPSKTVTVDADETSKESDADGSEDASESSVDGSQADDDQNPDSGATDSGNDDSEAASSGAGSSGSGNSDAGVGESGAGGADGGASGAGGSGASGSGTDPEAGSEPTGGAGGAGSGGAGSGGAGSGDPDGGTQPPPDDDDSPGLPPPPPPPGLPLPPPPPSFPSTPTCGSSTTYLASNAVLPGGVANGQLGPLTIWGETPAGARAEVTKTAGTGLAVKGGRYDNQIDYIAATGASERLTLALPADVCRLTLLVSMLANDGGLAETGNWTAYSNTWVSVGRGRISGALSTPAGSNSDRYNFTFAVPPSTAYIVINASGYDHGQSPSPDSNNSDFAIEAVSLSILG